MVAVYYLDWLLFSAGVGGILVDLGGRVFANEVVKDWGELVAIFAWYAFLVVIAVEAVVWLALWPIVS